jgi:carboxypeptidase C (cathepsin A)
MFIDNPAGVGFSYAAGEEDTYNNDMSDSADLYQMMQEFYKYWPELLDNHLYIGGESYGGSYAPHLAWRLHIHN